MNLYVYGTGILSGAGNNSDDDFLSNAPDYDTDRLLCREPDYKAYIPPMQLRRMSKAVRMGIGAAKIAAGGDRTDAISVGTAYGCLHDTEIFLSKMVEQNEQMLTPTAFIQSTHNTVAGQIALLTGCHGHNLTYVHRGHSFEHAMINAQLYLNDHAGEKMLVGGIEELTETSVEVLKQAKVYREGTSKPESILKDIAEGSIAGEGASFFLVGDEQKSKGSIVIKDICCFATRDTEAALQNVADFLHFNDLRKDDINLAVLGINGDKRSAAFYKRLREEILDTCSQAAFKHLCGEYPVASSFAVGMISEGIKKGFAPGSVLNHPPKKINRILLVNNFLHHYSCWYLCAG
jgi:hypothetical protein